MALARISDFLSDPDSALMDLLGPSQVAFSKATNLAFMLVRYRFSITLWAARFAAFPEGGGSALVGSFGPRIGLRSDEDVFSG